MYMDADLVYDAFAKFAYCQSYHLGLAFSKMYMTLVRYEIVVGLHSLRLG